MSQKNREPGFYWVKVYMNSLWQVAYFDEFWTVGKRNHLLADWELSEIDERQIVREEPSK